MRIIDLRSDTCSLPDEAMKTAMMSAAVGNDSFGDDPSVNALLSELCGLTGKEDAIFCCSGTMANLVAGMAYASSCGFGSEVMMDSHTHTYWYEMGSLSTVAGLSVRTVQNTGEYLPLPEVKKALRPHDMEMVRSRLLWTENTYMLGGGIPIPVQKMAELYAFAQENELRVHLDGARLFNAAIALDTEVSNITKHVDSVQICLSKCLCAPFGSVLLGNADFIALARRCRQAIGGGLRQAGYMAAAGSYALGQYKQTLPVVHRLAKKLAEGLGELFPGSIDPAQVQTNLVLFDPSVAGISLAEAQRHFEEHGVRIITVPTNAGEKNRLSVYPGITDADIDTALKVAGKMRSVH